MFFALLNLFSITTNQLNECYINKQVAYFKSV